MDYASNRFDQNYMNACKTAWHSDSEMEKEDNQPSSFDDESLLADIAADTRFNLEDTAVGSKEDLSESEETETVYRPNEEQTESDKEKKDPATQQTESPTEAAWTVIKVTFNLYNFEEEQEPHHAYAGPGPDEVSHAFPQ